MTNALVKGAKVKAKPNGFSIIAVAITFFVFSGVGRGVVTSLDILFLLFSICLLDSIKLSIGCTEIEEVLSADCNGMLPTTIIQPAKRVK